MPEDPILDQVLTAIHAGERQKARELLARLIKADPRNPRYWLWMSAVVDTSREAVYCLQEVLKFDPDNALAKQELIFLGARKPKKTTSETLFTSKSNWQEELTRAFLPPPGEKSKTSAAQKQSTLVKSIATAAGVVILILVILLPRMNRTPTAVITLVPPTARASATYLPTATPKGFRPTPTPELAPALWMLLEKTYTPTPFYVDTPHPSEAYQLAMRAFAKSDWETFNRYMDQELDTDPNSADLYFYMGEAARLQGNSHQALLYYEKSMNLNPTFAAAILSHAQVLKSVKPQSNILNDLNRAIQYDPALTEAYLTRAAMYREKGDLEHAMADLHTAHDLNPDSPRVYLGMAQVYLEEDNPTAALENAQKANQLDLTLLDSYLVLGTAYIANGQAELALEPLNTYLTYQPYDANAYEMVGKAYWIAGDTDKALENLNKSVSMDSNSFDAHYILGVSALKAGNPAEAFASLTKAVSINDNHYEAVFYRAQALLQLKRNTDAYNQFLRAGNLAETDEQKAECIYFQARAALAMGDRSKIRDAYRQLLTMPEEEMPEEWRIEADAYLNPCSGTSCATLTATYATMPQTTTGQAVPSAVNSPANTLIP